MQYTIYFTYLALQAPGPSCARLELELGEARSPDDILWDYCAVWPTGQDQRTIRVERPRVKARHVAIYFPLKSTVRELRRPTAWRRIQIRLKLGQCMWCTRAIVERAPVGCLDLRYPQRR